MGEETRKRSRATLAPHDLGIGRLFERVTDAIIVSNAAGEIVLWNPAAERIFGWTSEEAVGCGVSIIVPERLRAQHLAGMERWRRSGVGKYMDAQSILQLPALRKDGSEIVVEMTLSQLDAKELYVLSVLRDVTERARLMENLEDERRRLRQANEALEAFSYVVSHDLKEPVRALHARLEAAEEQFPEGESLEHLQEARKATHRLSDLLQGLLEWSRASMGTLDLERLDVAEVIASPACRTQFEGLLAERRANLDVAPDLPDVRATPAMLCQILGNLVVNALRHNPAPTPQVRISSCEAPLGRVCLVVDDNGPGFSPEVLRRFSVLGSGVRGTLGGGFGLALAQRAVERLEGTLHLENRPEGGARVRIELPAP